MELPSEIWMNIFIQSNNNIEIIKPLRSLCRTLLTTSYDYFKILLGKPILVHYNNEVWNAGEEPTPYKDYRFNHSLGTGPLSFKITIGDVYLAHAKSKIKYSYW
jgi:hypothetical protein